MNYQEAYQQELDRLRAEKMSDAMDLLFDDPWFHMGRTNESLFEQAGAEGDDGELGRIIRVGIENCLHKLVNHDRVAEMCGRGDRDESELRDAQDRRRDLACEARSAGI